MAHKTTMSSSNDNILGIKKRLHKNSKSIDNPKTLKNYVDKKLLQDKKYCAPQKSYDIDSTCYTVKSLKKIAEMLNKNEGTEINVNKNPHELYDDIQKHMKNRSPCEHEFCWLESDLFKKHLISNLDIYLGTFRPIQPKDWSKNKNAWLSTTNIRDVLLQYELQYPFMEFIGPTPLDFDKVLKRGECVMDELCKLNIDKLYNSGKHKIGTVVNLDKHNETGSHWVSLYADFHRGAIYFFDSVANFPKQEIVDLMIRIKNQINILLLKNKKLQQEFTPKYPIEIEVQQVVYNNNKAHIRANINEIPLFYKNMLVTSDNTLHGDELHDPIIGYICDINSKNNTIVCDTTKQNIGDKIYLMGCHMFWNDIEHQTKNTECGMYSIHFIHSMLDGTEYEDYCENIKDDEYIARFRDAYFRPNYNNIDDIEPEF